MFHSTLNKINYYFEKRYPGLARKALPKLIHELEAQQEIDFNEITKYSSKLTGIEIWKHH